MTQTVASEQYGKAYDTYETRKWKHVVKLAKKAVAEVYKGKRKAALRRTMALTHLSRSERMRLAYTRDYLGFDLDEFKLDTFAGRDQLQEWLAFHGLEDKLATWEKDAERTVRVPKILQTIPDEEPEQPDLTRLKVVLKPRKIDKDKLKKIKV